MHRHASLQYSYIKRTATLVQMELALCISKDSQRRLLTGTPFGLSFVVQPSMPTEEPEALLTLALTDKKLACEELMNAQAG